MTECRSVTESSNLRIDFAERGYAGPIRVLAAGDCKAFAHAVQNGDRRPPLDWDKGSAVTSRAFLELAMQPAIVDVVCALLGEDVMLWGASIQERTPGAVHPWHTDIESAGSPGKTVSVWIGLEHTSRDSSLRLAAGSQRFGITVQELRYRAGVAREETSDEDVMRWARERDALARIEQPGMSDGEALFLDGRLWHGSRNGSRETRRAVLLQYATPDAPIRIPDLNHLDWPFQSIELPRPACIMVRGNDTARVNRVLAAPVAVATDAGCELTSRVYQLRLPLRHDDATPWKPYPVFKGATANLGSLSCHVSTLQPGATPHPPHTHDEEEILVLLGGDADLTLPRAERPADRKRRLEPGHFVYYPAHFAHTLTTAGDEPANYLMLKWRNRVRDFDGQQLGFGWFRPFEPADAAPIAAGFHPRLVFEGATGCLRKLHCHASTVTPGAGYDAHIDAHDVFILVIEGEVETLGQRVGPHGVIFYPAGEPHGLRNCGEALARYAVFEFHGL